jgi:hypothetical protein
MSNGDKALIALGLAAVLGGAYWGWTAKLKPSRDKAKADAKKPFAGLAADQTTEILLRKDPAPQVLLRRVEGTWRLISPVAAPADPAAVDSLVKALGDLDRDEIIAEKDAELRQYGLDRPSGAVSFVPATPGAQAKVLFFGSDNPTGSSAYAMVNGETQVFMTALSNKNAILKDAGELRDKKVWSFDEAAVAEIRSSKNGGFVAKRSAQGPWTVTSASGEEPGRGAAVEKWLGELAALKAASVPSEDGRKGSFSIGKGTHLKLTLKSGVQLELNAGATAKDGGFYVQGKPGTPVFLLPSSATATFEKLAHDLADRQAFGFDPALVERFEVKRPGGTLTAVKASGAWSWQGIPPKGKEFDFGGFLDKLAAAELLKRLPASVKPAKVDTGVYLYTASGALLDSAEFGAKRDGGVLAVSGTKKLVSVVAGNLLEGLPPADAAAKK